jgi:hypothetical protein
MGKEVDPTLLQHGIYIYVYSDGSKEKIGIDY